MLYYKKRKKQQEIYIVMKFQVLILTLTLFY